MPGNKSPFCTDFGRGIFDSFWNSYITAATVGYGDIVVQSVPGRVLVILWITVSTMLFTMLTGTFASALGAILTSVSAFPDMSNNKVSVLANSPERTLVIQSGGLPLEKADLLALLTSVRSGESTLALINSYSYLTQFPDKAIFDANSWSDLRLSVTQDFAVSVGFLLTLSNTNNLLLSQCLQQQSFLNKLLGDGHWDSLASNLLIQQTESSDSSVQLFLTSEILLAVALLAAILLLILLTALLFRFLLHNNSHCFRKQSQKSDDNNSASNHVSSQLTSPL